MRPGRLPRSLQGGTQMNIRPEDKPKMAGIVAAIVGLNIYVFTSIIPRLSGAQPAPPAPSVPATPIAAPAVSPTATGAASPANAIDLDTNAAPKEVAPDPFKPPPGVPMPDAPPAVAAKP